MFSRLEVRDLAAMELASLMKLTAKPDASWNSADWAALREKTRKELTAYEEQE
jgi:hypothetical protein